jgi:hypothetical protein
MAKIATLKKPTLTPDAVRAFAEGAPGAQTGIAHTKGAARSENAHMGQRAGLVPAGDVRLTANIRSDLHLKLKIRAATERTTVGELIEQWVESWKP